MSLFNPLTRSVEFKCSTCAIHVVLPRAAYVNRLRLSPSKRLYCSRSCAAVGLRKAVHDQSQLG